MNQARSPSVPDVLFLSHGGGPLPLLGDTGHLELVASLQHIATRIAKPAAAIVISAHWEQEHPTVTHAVAPALIYDYYGFSPQSYEIRYPCRGNPALAERLHAVLEEKGLQPIRDAQRGFDHGFFVPMKIMYPQADIPCVQLSLVQGLDPATHIRVGQAIAELQESGLLVIGSGFSFHNMRAFFAPPTAQDTAMNQAFEQWLIDTCANPSLSEEERVERLLHWEQAPHARYCHPREEHLLPLHVCYGAAQRACREVFEMQILGKKASAYLW